MTETTVTTLPDWTTFERDYVTCGIPHRFSVRAMPEVALFVDQGARRLGARFETSAPRLNGPAHLPAEIHVDDVANYGSRAIEIWTDTERLFANFYRLVCEIVGAVVDNGADPDTALRDAIARWEALLSRPSLISDEAQAGLFGELWLLDRLISALGPAAVEAWVGPVRQPHDFRLGDIELEVKTTSGAVRTHTINTAGQLQPTLNCILYLLSLKLVNAGSGGRSLPEAVEGIEAALLDEPNALNKFRAGLDAVGYDTGGAHLYSRRWRLRDRAMLIHVADGVPRLTPDALATLPARFAPERIERVIYNVNVEGLGIADGAAAFHTILPPNRTDFREPQDV